MSAEFRQLLLDLNLGVNIEPIFRSIYITGVTEYFSKLTPAEMRLYIIGTIIDTYLHKLVFRMYLLCDPCRLFDDIRRRNRRRDGHGISCIEILYIMALRHDNTALINLILFTGFIPTYDPLIVAMLGIGACINSNILIRHNLYQQSNAFENNQYMYTYEYQYFYQEDD